ncbi:ATPase associated with various cellular activities AAA_5 (plasmid) [Oceanithermus profundus DSM 14977]|uniref:ATPase associated with various cellular activities AAA_5 n=1 Tax=Oceanithermus profundus (strain DSM 14977 / NBRC 100410 / VKM B-2274 / 506) TaxID=670487 RepID=E4UAV0_OCEP5|nr:AAA family ATPase [Oceanithermus profundus]ADR37735.1 ATPase associated with various cellular activities AAA_5 [Oceanithermus profundus DSM 14977]
MKLEDYLELADRTGIVPFFWGDPGVGKTARIEQWAKAKGYHLERLVLSQHDPTEVAGIYVATEGARRAERAVPAWLARVLEAAKQGRRAVVFFDELTTAAPTVQDTALGIFNERVVGDVPLPEGVILLAAANPPDRVDGLWELSAALANRFLHVEVRPDFQAWRAWAEEQGEAHRIVAHFLDAHPQHFHDFPTHAGELAWPSARTWDKFARALEEVLEERFPEEGLYSAGKGLVGKAAATTFVAWYQEYKAQNDIPPDQVLADPAGAAIPSRSDVLARLAETLVKRVAEALEGGRDDAQQLYARLIAYLRRVDAAGHRAVALATAQQITKAALENEVEDACARALGDEEVAFLESVSQNVLGARAA